MKTMGFAKNSPVHRIFKEIKKSPGLLFSKPGDFLSYVLFSIRGSGAVRQILSFD
jgi:hypothetical protein